MSVTLSAYLVHLDQLRAVYGCADVGLLRNLEQTYADDLETDEQPREVWVLRRAGEEYLQEPVLEIHGPRVPTLRQAFHALINGTIPAVGDGSPYAYALELVCRFMGTTLPNEHFESFRGIDVLHEIGRLGDLDDMWNPPMPIPHPQDLLGVTHVSPEEALVELARIPEEELSGPTDLSDWAHWDGHVLETWNAEWIKRMRNQYRSWLEESIRTRASIVAFLY